MERCGSRIRKLAQDCIAAAARRGLVRTAREFVWSVDEHPVVPRTNVGASEERTPAHIAPEEVRQAVLDVVSASFGLTRAECVAEVARAFGFERTGSRLRAWAEKAVDAALAEGAVTVVGDQTLVLPRQ